MKPWNRFLNIFSFRDIKDFEVIKPKIVKPEEVIIIVDKKEPYKDPLTIQRIMLLHPLLRQEGLKMYNEICEAVSGRVVVRCSHTLRSFLEQNNLFEIGRSLPGSIVTWARGGFSFHNYGLAIDIVLLVDKDGNGTFETASWSTVTDFDGDGKEDWMEVVEIFEKYGWQWGLINKKGKRYDLPHFQKTLGYTISQLRVMPKDKDGYPIFK